MSDYQYNPIRTGPDWRTRIRRLVTPVVAAVIALAKWSFVLLKFGSIFIAIGGYALLFGWKFAVGLVLLILVHELGHYVVARREGLNPKLPVFIPFFAAYVRYTRGHPWQTVKIAIAGPIVGGVGALVCLLVARAENSPLFYALGYVGFFLNVINMLPLGPLDGGAVWRSARWLRLGGGREKAYVAYAIYVMTAAALIIGMVVTYRHQTRL